MEELAAGRHHGVAPKEWDALPVEERERLMAAFRDFSDLESISNLSKEERSNLRGKGEWIVLNKEQ